MKIAASDLYQKVLFFTLNSSTNMALASVKLRQGFIYEKKARLILEFSCFLKEMGSRFKFSR